MRNHLRASAAALALALSGVVTTASAAPVIRDYDVSGTFTDGSVLSGFLDIDVTDGTITTAHLVTTGPSAFVFDHIVNQSDGVQVPGDHNVGIRNANSTEDFNFDLLGSLVNFDQDFICSRTSPCVNGRGSGLFDLTTSRSGAGLVEGDLTLIPEPATIAMTGLGLVVALVARRRRRG
jgi:hypothetical protein